MERLHEQRFQKDPQHCDITVDHLIRGEDGPFLLYVLPVGWEALLVM